jgi:hypothetical protein
MGSSVSRNSICRVPAYIVSGESIINRSSRQWSSGSSKYLGHVNNHNLERIVLKHYSSSASTNAKADRNHDTLETRFVLVRKPNKHSSRRKADYGAIINISGADLANREFFTREFANRETFISEFTIRKSFNEEFANRKSFISEFTIRKTFISELATRKSFIEEFATRKYFLRKFDPADNEVG